jgi:hypothetical protein
MMKNVLLLSALIGLGNLALACSASTGTDEPNASTAGAVKVSPSLVRCPKGEVLDCGDTLPNGKPLCSCELESALSHPVVNAALVRCPKGEVLECDDTYPNGKPLCSCEVPSGVSTESTPTLKRCPPGEVYGCFDLGPTGKPICGCQ